jgi:hypothetical protein
VSTPLHAETAKQFHKIRTLYPVFYQQLVELFPEILTHERYWKQLDRYSVINLYPHTFDGIIKFIEETFEDDYQIELAKQRVNTARTIRENNISRGTGTHNFGGYPIQYVFKAIINGQYKRVIQPCRDPSKADIEYEKGGEK